jgi:hypothetical protein
MLHLFDSTLDRRVSALALPATAQSALAQQRDKLAGAELPPELKPETRQLVREAIDQSFVRGFRAVMLIACVLALGSAGSALWLIRDKPSA